MFTETRTYPLEVREIDGDGMFTGHASIFGNVDSYGTIFDAGCFKRTIKAHKGAFPLTVNHEWWDPIGMARGVKEDATGLLIEEGYLNIETPRANTVYMGLAHDGNPASGYYSDMSHGFRTVRETDDKDGVAHKKEVILSELAIVTMNFGANPEAGVEQVRAATEHMRRLNTALKTGNEDRFIEEVAKLRTVLETYNVSLPAGEDIGTTATLVKAEGPSLDTRTLQDSVLWLQGVIEKTMRGDRDV